MNAIESRPVRRALVVYESMYGNTAQVAKAIAEGMAMMMPTDLSEVSEAPTDVAGFDVVVVGGPTHAWTMSRERTREAAHQHMSGPLVSEHVGMREWLETVRGTPAAVATFDTKLRRPPMPGSAARAASRAARKHGWQVLDRPHTFYVKSTTGPLVAGEDVRARRWGEELAMVA